MKFSVFTISCLIITALAFSCHAQSADTILTFQKAKSRVLNYNLGPLAAYYEIGISKANADMYYRETNEHFNLIR
jgi:hypothetical protein